MMGQRTLVAAIITPLALAAIYLGGYPYQALIVLLLAITSWEYSRLLKKINLHTPLILVIGGVVILGVVRAFFDFNYLAALLAALTMLAAAYHILDFERRDTRPAVDFGATLSILIYVGFLGSYLISLRGLENGRWWTFVVLPTVWIADTAAYLVGSTWGKHKLAPKTSPHKTWEGYFAGVLAGILSSPLLVALYNRSFQAGITISVLEAALLGLAIAAFIPLGDLTESMIKRQANEKDSGTILPGHGGIFDRLDSLFWAAPIGYYLILHLFIQ
jgi:phosphatidate cytidylyltransferase